MSRGITKKERAELKRKQETKRLKAERMRRGDEKQAQNVPIVSEPVEKTISNARAQRLALAYLAPHTLKDLIKDKCIYSKVYDRQGIEATIRDSNECGFAVGLQLDLNHGSGKKHYFGFEVIDHPERGSLIRVHYAAVTNDGAVSTNPVRDMNPKKFSARDLVDMISQYK